MNLFIAPHTTLHFAPREELHSFLPLEKRYALIADAHVHTLYGQVLEKDLKDKGLDVSVFSIPSGEGAKTREIKHAIEDAMLELNLSRDTCIIALGGGATLDLAGFIAATYCRGISFVSVPTTLLAMVDASIGGKTGVNTLHGKNLIGAFYPASMVLIDTAFLNTLPENEWKNGYAEMIKYGCMHSSLLFDLLEKKQEDLLYRNNLKSREFDKKASQNSHLEQATIVRAQGANEDENFEKKPTPSKPDSSGCFGISACIHHSIEIKKKIIESDFHEKGMRRTLNFGHTLGHALETIYAYRIAHGQAVAMGIAFESFLSMQLGFLKNDDYQRILKLLKHYGFSLDLLKNVAFDDLMQAMSRDKKALKSLPRFAMLESIGSALSCEGQYCMAISPEILKEAYTHYGK